jgi:hypothetical protein
MTLASGAYTYSFQDVNATITGPGGNFGLANGAGVSAEGITFAHTDPKDTIVTGADGSIMHSLHAGMTGSITVRLLKASPVNGMLSSLYNYQRIGGSALWGKNVISINNSVQGDNIGGVYMAFAKHPDVVYATEGNMNEWEFTGYIVPELGQGLVGLINAAVASVL